jgi:hypothetical protein
VVGRGAGPRKPCLLALLVGPAEEVGDDLEDLEFLGVGAVEGEKLEEVVCY